MVRLVDLQHLIAVVVDDLEALFFGEGGHDEEGVAEDKAVGPVLVVVVEVDLLLEGEAIEVGEEVLLADLAGLGGLAEVLDEGLGLDFLLYVDGDGGDGERRSGLESPLYDGAGMGYQV